MLDDQSTHGGRQGRGFGSSSRHGSRRLSGSGLCDGRRFIRFARCRRRARRCSLTLGQDGHHITRMHHIAGLDPDLGQHARTRRRHFQHHLVGFQIQQIVFAIHGLTGLFVPGHDRGVFDGFRQLGDLDLDTHDDWLSPDG